MLIFISKMGVEKTWVQIFTLYFVLFASEVTQFPYLENGDF